MAYLIVNNKTVDFHFDTSIPMAAVQELVTHLYGENIRFSIELSDSEKHAQKRKEIREQITQSGEDTQSLLGTTTDAVHLLLYHFAKFNIAVNKASNLEDIKLATASFNELAHSFVNNVDNGITKMPFQTKTEKQVISDIGSRASIINNAISSDQS